MNDYQRIEKAIHYLVRNFKEQPDLEKLAAYVGLSSSHFQRLFSKWAGVSPKKFLQYLSIEHAKTILRNDRDLSLLDVSDQTGLSGTGRLHDLFITIEGMTPGEYKNGGSDLFITYSFSETIFGNVIIASTSKGICHLAFIDSEETSLIDLHSNFPQAKFEHKRTADHEKALLFFKRDENVQGISLHLKGSKFQLKVWQALLKIPTGKLVSYGNLANEIGLPKASRSVGTAIGSNPIAFLIPCHRVIQASGNFGNYMWGPDRKACLIGWEAAGIDKNNLE